MASEMVCTQGLGWGCMREHTPENKLELERVHILEQDQQVRSLGHTMEKAL